MTAAGGQYGLARRIQIAVAFAIFAAISLYMIMQFGDQVDMSGEKHGADAVHAPTPAEAK